MSKHEPRITRRYWDTQVAGLLVEEFPLIASVDGGGRRCVDALILPSREKRIARRGEKVSLGGERVVLVQTKAGRLGMSLMGQTLFSVRLFLERFKPASVLSVALCSKDDTVLHAMLEKHPECRVVIISEDRLKETEFGGGWT